ncbi:MAG: hypothetical protein JW751_03250 [Polyangiaceae bacterium]|nr:hypothetical protein [Polyangiaceae bacterium]
MLRGYDHLPSEAPGICAGDGAGPPANFTWDEPRFVSAITPEAVQAWRLFDDEQWAQAIPLLEAVALGRYGDCLGDRQLAEYKLAIALARTNDWTAATDLFIAITECPRHVKHDETLLWLVKAATDRCPTRRVLRALARYPVSSTPFSNPKDPHLHEVFVQALFARARGLQEAGRTSEAYRIFFAMRQEPSLGEAATECLEQMSQE